MKNRIFNPMASLATFRIVMLTLLHRLSRTVPQVTNTGPIAMLPIGFYLDYVKNVHACIDTDTYHVR